VIIIVDEKGERVPFTISVWDREAGTVELVYMEVGTTTRQMASLKVGDQLAHFVGPLGKPAEVDHFGHVIAVASGYGIAAMVPILKAYREKKNRTTTIVQAPDRERLFGQTDLEAVSDRLILAVGANGEDMAVSTTRPLRKLLANHPQNLTDRLIVMSSIYSGPQFSVRILGSTIDRRGPFGFLESSESKVFLTGSTGWIGDVTESMIRNNEMIGMSPAHSFHTLYPVILLILSKKREVFQWNRTVLSQESWRFSATGAVMPGRIWQG